LRTLFKGILVVLVGFLVVLVPIGPAMAASHREAEMQLQFLVGAGQICSLAAKACPDVSSAANGDTVSLAGQGTISTGGDENSGRGDATGQGTFVHMKSDGSVFAHGTWKATGLVSFTAYGSGSVQGLPANFQGGLATISITLRADDTSHVLHGTLAVECVLGHPPTTAVEGTTLTVPNLITFNTKVSGFTLFIAGSN
jgi:hypothetical protein